MGTCHVSRVKLHRNILKHTLSVHLFDSVFTSLPIKTLLSSFFCSLFSCPSFIQTREPRGFKYMERLFPHPESQIPPRSLPSSRHWSSTSSSLYLHSLPYLIRPSLDLSGPRFFFFDYVRLCFSSHHMSKCLMKKGLLQEILQINIIFRLYDLNVALTSPS